MISPSDDHDPETIALRATVIGGKCYPDDRTVIWREMTVGRTNHETVTPGKSLTPVSSNVCSG